jgi:hypothetical protein
MLKSLITFFTIKNSVPDPDPDQFQKIETIQDALAKLRALYSSHDLKRCEEITDLIHTLKDAHSFNPLTPISFLPASKKHLISKYL